VTVVVRTLVARVAITSRDALGLVEVAQQYLGKQSCWHVCTTISVLDLLVLTRNHHVLRNVREPGSTTIVESVLVPGTTW